LRDGTYQYVDGVSSHFSSIDMTPPEYHTYHIQFWRNLASKHHNIKLIKFEELTFDFEKVLEEINDFLGASVSEFDDIEQQVGWKPLNTTEYLYFRLSTILKKVINKFSA